MNQSTAVLPKQETEERLVAELEQMGVRYLARRTAKPARRVRAGHKLLADLVQQPSSRVRTALISLLLARPAYGDHIPAALEQLEGEQALMLKFFYSAAVVLQRQYAASLQTLTGADFRWLTDWFGAEHQLPAAPPQEQLKALAHLHEQATGIRLNWAGTYEQAARQLLRRLELERKWNR